MQSWLYLACGLLIIAYTLFWVRLRRTRVLLSGLPSYPQLPLIGNLLQVVGDGRHLFLLLQDISEKMEKAMLPFLIWFGPYPVLIFSDSDDVKAVTNTYIEKPYYYNFGKLWLGDGLVTASAAEWKQNIKRLANTFNPTVVGSYQLVFNAHAEKLVDKLKERVGEKPFDAMHLLTHTTLEAICQTALGVACISESIVTEEYYEAFSRCLVLLITRGLNPLMHFDWVYRLTRGYDEFKKCVTVLHNVSDTILRKRKLEREKERSKKNGLINRDLAEGKKFKAFLDILLDISEEDSRLTEQQIKNEIDTIIVGGQETVASTLFYAILMIGCKPEVQQKLHEELKSIFGVSTRPLENEDLPRMQYCEAVINETLRLYPPVPGVMRHADRDLQLKSCKVPKNTICCINVLGSGRAKRTWGPDALEFNPGRWLDGTVPTTPASFIPFSYGRRACIGKKYAMAILKTMLAYCLRELEFQSEADKLELKLDLALRPHSGHLMAVKLRNQQ